MHGHELELRSLLARRPLWSRVGSCPHSQCRRHLRQSRLRPRSPGSVSIATLSFLRLLGVGTGSFEGFDGRRSCSKLLRRFLARPCTSLASSSLFSASLTRSGAPLHPCARNGFC